MIDILVYVFERYEAFAKRPKPQALALKLQAAGFEEDEISEAIDWLNALADAPAPCRAAQAGACRVFTANEVRELRPDGIDFLCFLERVGVLDAQRREVIIDRAMAIRTGQMTLERLKVIVLMVLWSQSATLDPLVVEELLGQDDAPMH